MKECHVCLFMCDDSAELCPVCGAELKPATGENAAAEAVAPIEGENGTGVINNPVLAASADSPVTAEIFKDMLTENGIAHSVDEKGDFLHTGFGGGFFAVDIYVDEKDLEAAKEIYRNISENEFTFEDFDGFAETEGEQ